MAYEVKVSTGDVAAKATSIQQQAANIEDLLGKLTSDMQALAGTWTGSAATAFQDMFQSWGGTAKQMQQALDGIGRSLQGAGQNYDELESKLTSQFR